ncbi:MAG: leucine-rich repeat domain-containing protein [Candidatus Heimdallarchaeota archaeon]|nr:leucine-rich repeat domain-containing protein [Candidatus Heimdallarchaeota archaeon]
MANATGFSQEIIKRILSKLGKISHYEKVISSYRTILSENRIISLDLIGLGLQELDANIFDEINGITQLYLSWNDISILPNGVFDKLNTLQYLDLRGSGLIEIQNGIFDKLQNLQRLELNDNKLKKIPTNTFDKLFSLKEINLSNNHIEFLEKHIFDKLINLEFLYLYFNPLPGDISFGNYYDRESVEELIDLLKSRFTS